MYIYSISNKNEPKEIYIGKTKNPKDRFYTHLSCITCNAQGKKYEWMRKVGKKNLVMNILFEYDDNDSTDYEKQYIERYQKEGYTLFNDQLNDYHPDTAKQKCFEDREAVWRIYSTTKTSRREICEMFGISNSLLSKIIQEHGGSPRKGKLFGHYEEIQQKIMTGVPIKQLAREYGVADNSISNINKGITAYDPNLSYPLNKEVRDQIIQDSWFKPKV